MLLTVTGPAGHRQQGSYDNMGLSLGAFLQEHADNIEACFVNGRACPQWRAFVPQQGDRINLIGGSGDFWGILIGLLVNLALSMIVRALTPTPQKPKLDGKRGESFGIAGFQNTTGQGVPIPVWRGRNRVHGHAIGSGLTVSDDHKSMFGKVLYCLGDSGGDTYNSVSEILIDKIDIAQFEGVVAHVRLGSLTQTVIPGFEDVANLFFLNQQIPFDDDTDTGTPIVYRNRGDSVNKSVLILSFPSGLWRVNSRGAFRPDIVVLRVEQKLASDPDTSYVTITPPADHVIYPGMPDAFRLEYATHSQVFPTIVIDHAMIAALCQAAADQYWLDRPDVAADPFYGVSIANAYQHYLNHGQFEGSVWHDELCGGTAVGKFDIRMTIMLAGVGAPDEATSHQLFLFNVEETTFTTETYPGYVLLALTNIPAKQIRSLESMEVSALVEGKLVKIPDGLGNTVLTYTRQPCWNIRDMMTHPICGMGYEVDESEIDDEQWLNEAQAYYDELVPGQDGDDEPRSLFDYGCTARMWDWDEIKKVAGERRGRIIPSGLLWKYIIDKPGDPDLLYCEPGNVIDGSLRMEIAPPDRPFNQVIAEFRDEADDYNPNISQPIDSPDPAPSAIQEAFRYDSMTRESEVLRENMIVMKRQLLERRRWNFVSPMRSIVSEPLGLDWLSEREIGDQGAYSGLLQEGSTASTLILPMLVELLPGETYLAIVQHKNNTSESRTVSTPAGKYVAVDVTTPFTILPTAGDAFALGIENVDHMITRAQDLTIDNEGRVTQLRTEYVEAVYSPDALPPAIERRHFALWTVAPIPLRDAIVNEQVVLNGDGSQRSVLMFDVTPGMPQVAGLAQGGGTDFIILAITEPFREGYQDNYYKGAEIEVNGVRRWCIRYNASNRTATVGTTWGFTINAGDPYVIRFPRVGTYSGFIVETAEEHVPSTNHVFTEPTEHFGTHWERDGGDQAGTFFFRFTPFNPNGIRNNLARIVTGLTLHGDLSAPAPPLSVTLSAVLKFVTVVVTMQRPLAEDFSGIECEIRVATVDGPIVGKIRLGAQSDNAASGTMEMRFVFTVTTEPYGTIIWAKARSVDFSNNPKDPFEGWVNSTGPTVLSKITAADIE